MTKSSKLKRKSDFSQSLLLHLEEEMTSIYQLTSEDLNSLYVPRSMFRQDGSLLLGTDKATVMHEIEKMIREQW